MSISPSHRTEIRTLVKRLCEAPIAEARAAAARLRVIGPRAVPTLVRAAKKAPTDRILRLLPLFDDPRAVRALCGAFRASYFPSRDSEGLRRAKERTELSAADGRRHEVQVSGKGEGNPETIIELLAATGSNAAAKTLLSALPSSPPNVARAIRPALLVLSRRGVCPADGLEDAIEKARDLEARIEARSEDPLCDADTTPANPAETYFGLMPDAPAETAMRGTVASLLKPVEIARMLELERDERKLTLLCLLAEKKGAEETIPALHSLARRLDEDLPEQDADRRSSLLLLATRLHHALGAMKSRIALVELTRLLSGLRPEEIRVELLEVVKRIGKRPQVKELVPLAARDDWLGEAACRVIADIARREGISPRAAVLRPLGKERRREIRRMIDG